MKQDYDFVHTYYPPNKNDFQCIQELTLNNLHFIFKLLGTLGSKVARVASSDIFCIIEFMNIYYITKNS